MTKCPLSSKGHGRSVSTARRICAWLAPYRVQVASALGLTAAACALNLPVPFLIQGLIDQVVAAGKWWTLPVYAIGLLALFAAQAGFGLANALVVGRVGQGVVRDLRHRLYDRLQRLGLAYYDQTPTGAIISRLMDDVGAIQLFVTAQTTTILTDVGSAVAISALLMARGGRMALVVLVFVPLYVVNFRYFMRRIRGSSTTIRTKMDSLFGHLKEKIDGALVIKAYAQESAEERSFADQLADVHVPRVQESRLTAAFSNISAAISGIGTSAVFTVGAIEVLQGRMTPGAAVSAAALAALLFGPIGRLADLLHVFEQASASVD